MNINNICYVFTKNNKFIKFKNDVNLNINKKEKVVDFMEEATIFNIDDIKKLKNTNLFEQLTNKGFKMLTLKKIISFKNEHKFYSIKINHENYFGFIKNSKEYNDSLFLNKQELIIKALKNNKDISKYLTNNIQDAIIYSHEELLEAKQARSYTSILKSINFECLPFVEVTDLLIE